jgi:hypothetical protein
LSESRKIELLDSIDKGTIIDIHEDTANYNLTSDIWIKSVKLNNNGASDIVLSVVTANKTFIATIKPNEVFDESFTQFKQLSISATTPYRLITRG